MEEHQIREGWEKETKQLAIEKPGKRDTSMEDARRVLEKTLRASRGSRRTKRKYFFFFLEPVFYIIIYGSLLSNCRVSTGSNSSHNACLSNTSPLRFTANLLMLYVVV